MSKNLIYLNGSIVPEEEARVSCLDPGFLYGQGLFETMRAYDGVVFQIDNHLNRLSKGLPLIRVDSDFSSEDLKEAVRLILQENNLSNAYVRLNIWQGQEKVNICIIAREFCGYPADTYKAGFKAMITECRHNENSLLTNIKSFNYLQFYLSRLQAQSEGFNEAIFLNSKSYVSEGSRSSVFIVKNSNIVTPSLESGCLTGITRAVVIDLSKKAGYKICEKDILLDELLNADEVFLSGSLLEIMPVISIDAKRIGSGLPGIITLSLLEKYRDLISKTKEKQ